MARKVILKDNGLNGSSSSPTGYKYLGYDGDIISDKNGSTVSSIGGGNGFPITGGTMSGDIELGTGVDIIFTPKLVKGNTLTGGLEQTVNGIALATSVDISNRTGKIEAIAGNAQMSSYDTDFTAGTEYSVVQSDSSSAYLEAGNITGGTLATITVNVGGSISINSATGQIALNGLPVYADNAAALSGGLVIDNVYKTVTGELRIVV
jgi:hypothetical protein